MDEIQALCRVADEVSEMSDDVPFGRSDEQHGDQFDGTEQREAA